MLGAPQRLVRVGSRGKKQQQTEETAVHVRLSQEGSKQFFFEKKNQKTFGY
jgi:hypothetical protein